jgi:hypothetical protein
MWNLIRTLWEDYALLLEENARAGIYFIPAYSPYGYIDTTPLFKIDYNDKQDTVPEQDSST